MKYIHFLPIYIIAVFIILTGMYFYTQTNDQEQLGAPKNTQLTTQEITAIMDKLNQRFATDAQYVQVTTDGRILLGNTEITDAQLKSLLPDNITITSYGGPCGQGFQIIQITTDHYYSWGYGCEAASRTFDMPYPI